MDYTPYTDLKASLRWRQGEHVTLVAPTGAGKTTLMRELLPMRAYSIFFGTKHRDTLYDSVLKMGYRRVESIEEIRPWDNKIMLWPKHEKTIRATVAKQRTRFRTAMDMIADQGGWSAYFDECKYMGQMLSLQTELTFCMEQLRSNNGTTISGAQRPMWLPRSVLANSSHVFLWKTTDSEDAKRLADIGGINRKTIMQDLATLGKHEFLYVHTRGTETNIRRSQVGR